MSAKEFEYNGKTYVSENSGRTDCEGCAFDGDANDCAYVPPCWNFAEGGGGNVIFKLKVEQSAVPANTNNECDEE